VFSGKASPDPPENRPVRPGEALSTPFFIGNAGAEAEFVLTVTVPEEIAFISLQSADLGRDVECSGNVCRGRIASGGGNEADNTRQFVFKGRLASSFRGTESMVRADLQEDANPDPEKRTTTSVVMVDQSASGSPSAAEASPSDGAGAVQTGGQALPATGGDSTVTGLLALIVLVLGAAVQRCRPSRPAGTLGSNRSERLITQQPGVRT
jgi:hypothetical protein